MRIAVYDEHWHTAGGGEKYAASFAEALAVDHEVHLLSPGPVETIELGEKLGVDLTHVRVRRLPPGPSALTAASAEYDLLLNCSYMSREPCAAPHGIYVTHFPTPFDHDLSPAKRLVRSTFGPIVRRRHGSVELGTGFYLPEQARVRTYRWTSDLAYLFLRLPPGASLPVALFLGGRPATGSPAEVEVRVDGAVAVRAEVPPGRRTVPVAFEALGPPDGRAVVVELAVSDAFVPSQLSIGHDERELGVKLFSVQVGRGPGAWLGRVAPLFALPSVSLAFLGSYDRIVANSAFTQDWVRRLWGRDSDVVYPAVEPIEAGVKQPLILSVGRFFEPKRGHSKKQLEMVGVFRQLVEAGLTGWEYRIVGGCHPEDEPYLAAVRRAAAGLPVSIEVDATGSRLRELYAQASIFWHATGLGEPEERRPWRLEHFGIAVVEAMSAGAVPIVCGRGGPSEIVEAGISGFHAANEGEFVTRTRDLVGDEALRRRLAEGAARRAEAFSAERFAQRTRQLVRETLSSS